jgi:pimeloyl-ACP methyl ester carboxylesterase
MLTVVERLALPYLRATGWSSRYVATRSGRLHVLELEGRGTLPPVVLLHGITSNGATLAGLAKKLAPHVSRVLAPDMPAHGFSAVPKDGLTPRSMTEGAFDLLDRVTTEPVILMGNSMGGIVATRYAAARPNRVAGLALVSPGGAPMDEGDYQRFLDTFRIRSYAEALHFVDLVFARPPALIRHFIARGVMSRFRHPALRNFLESSGSEDLLTPEEVASLRMPTLFIWGHEERILRPEHHRFWTSTLPAHAVRERWAQFGHIGIHEQEDQLAARLGAFAADAVASKRAHDARSPQVAGIRDCAQRAPVLRITPQPGTLAASA